MTRGRTINLSAVDDAGNRAITDIEYDYSPEQQAIKDAEEAALEATKPAREMAILRSKRNRLLAESDWTQGVDSPLTDEVKTTWITHRQKLRDLPASTDPADPTWPTPPE